MFVDIRRLEKRKQFYISNDKTIPKIGKYFINRDYMHLNRKLTGLTGYTLIYRIWNVIP